MNYTDKSYWLGAKYPVSESGAIKARRSHLVSVSLFPYIIFYGKRGWDQKWNRLTFFFIPEPELAIDKKSIVVVFTLPEEDVTKISKKDFEQIKLEDLKKETGFNTLLTFLDIHLAKDNLPDSLKKFEEFDDLNKLFVFKRLFIPYIRFSLIWRSHHCQWKATNFDPGSAALTAFEQWLFLACHPTVISDIRLSWSYPIARTHDTHTYCRAFINGTVTARFSNLGLSRLGSKHTTFRMRGERSNPLSHHCGDRGGSFSVSKCYEMTCIVWTFCIQFVNP